MALLTHLSTRDPETNGLLVVVETPKGSRNKIKYDEELGQFKLHKVLTLGAVFPFDFGFVPSTRGADGDPSTCWC
jgi:inorganic pyrophosphatase